MSVRVGGPAQRGTVAEHGSVEFRYPLDPASVRVARRVVAGVCRFWRAGDACDTATLAVSELVGNSVRAGAGEEVRLRLSWTPRRLRVEVCDESPDTPRLGQPDATAESGRGLWIVSQLAVRWGTQVQTHGKCVWAEIALPAAA